MLKKIRGPFIMLKECFSMSISNILGNKVRSFLTILGIMIGVAAVITLISTVSGVSKSLSDSFSSMGAGSLTVSITGSDLKSGLVVGDLDTLTQLESVEGLAPSVSISSARVSYGGSYESGISVAGKNTYYFQTNDVMLRGRQLNIVDENNSSYVCLVNADIIEDFFFGVDPIGKQLYIAGIPFQVVGTWDSEASTSVMSVLTGTPDILIPYTTAMKMNNTNEITSLTVYCAEGYESDAVKEELENALDALFSYEQDTYTVTSMSSIEDTMNTMLGMMSTLLAGIASIALVVGGIGIMNMMLTTVTERTQEIGLKKALGAIPWQIQIQFLIESFLLSVIGGMVGVVLGLLLSFILCQVMSTGFVINGGAIALGVGFSAAVGILFGWAPARKASRLNPIDALRSM